MESKRKQNQGGRPPKPDKAAHRYCVRLTDEDNVKFQRMLSDAGVDNVSRYLHHAIFDKQIKVVKIDKSTKDYYIRLTNFYHQFQAIGNNYNQTVKALKSNFSEKRVLAMLYKLEKATVELVIVSKKIIELTQEYEQRWLQR